MEMYERLLSHVKVSTVNSWNGMSCWEWQGNLNRGGYGRIGVGLRSEGTFRLMTTHRASWQEFRGPIPDGLCVCHRCDNRKCCNPAHLFLGTSNDNTKDMIEKGRKAMQRGEVNSQAKLREADIPVIRKRLAEGDAHRAIARDYGVGWSQIWRIGKGIKWAHVA